MTILSKNIHFLHSTILRGKRTVNLPHFTLSRNIIPRHKQTACSLDDDADYRKSIAPWLKFGEYHRGLLSHLSTQEILRALFVLQVCSIDLIVDKSTQLFLLSKKFGKLAQYLVRKTFYDQFVGGDEVQRMGQVVDLLHQRGLTLMVAPVLEEDVEDDKSSKDVYDENLNILKSLNEMVSMLDKDKPIIQLKLSAIMPAKTLEQINLSIMDAWKSPQKLAKLIEELHENEAGNWTMVSGISREDKEHFINGIKRADNFVHQARDLGVKVLVDAEFYSCQLAISTVAMLLMTKYNGNGYVVGDTIQGYLKESFGTVKLELEVIERLFGISWYGKIVRGAYMDRERLIARQKGVSSPICETYQHTSNSYNSCIDHVLRNLKGNSNKSHLLIATHNEKSIRLAVQAMKNLEISPKDDLASFAQIYGMADYLSTPLVKSNYKVYKSTPYGPLEKVVPYLARRASENRSVMKGAREERIMLRRELFSRIF